MEKLVHCPFCGSNYLGYSLKTHGAVYHAVVYCKSCHAYGPRLLIKRNDERYSDRYKCANDKAIKERATRLWNKTGELLTQDALTIIRFEKGRLLYELCELVDEAQEIKTAYEQLLDRLKKGKNSADEIYSCENIKKNKRNLCKSVDK